MTRTFRDAFRAALSRVLVERGRSALSVGAIGAAVALILVFEGFRAGLYEQLRSFPEQLPAPLVALQAGVSRIAADRSMLPSLTRQAVETVPGVRAAHPIAGIPIIYSAGGRRSPVYVVAYDTAGAPRSLVAGRPIEGEREIVADVALAAKYGLGLGSEVKVLDVPFHIVGLSSGTVTFFTPHVFARYVDVLDLYVSGAFGDLADKSPSSLLSFLLIELEPGVDVAAAREAIERAVADVDVFTPGELGDKNVELGRRIFGPVLALLVGIAYAIGALTIGITIFASAASRRAELAVMKAIGATRGRIAADMAFEVALLGVVSLVVGIALASGIAEAIQRAAPDYRVIPWSAGAIGRTMLACAALSVAGALLPVRSVARLEPAMALRS